MFNNNYNNNNNNNNKGNWSLKLNCARLKGTKTTNNLTPTLSSSDDQQPQLTSCIDKTDTCACSTTNRKVDVFLPTTPSQSQSNLPLQSSLVSSYSNHQLNTTTDSISELSTPENITGAGSPHALLIENATFYDDNNGNFILLSAPPMIDFSRLVITNFFFIPQTFILIPFYLFDSFYFLFFFRFNTVDYPLEDCDETARIQRAREIAEGVEPPPGFTPSISSDAITNYTTTFGGDSRGGDTLSKSSLLVNSQKIPNIAPPTTNSSLLKSNATTNQIVVYKDKEGRTAFAILKNDEKGRVHSQVCLKYFFDLL